MTELFWFPVLLLALICCVLTRWLADPLEVRNQPGLLMAFDLVPPALLGYGIYSRSAAAGHLDLPRAEFLVAFTPTLAVFTLLSALVNGLPLIPWRPYLLGLPPERRQKAELALNSPLLQGVLRISTWQGVLLLAAMVYGWQVPSWALALGFAVFFLGGIPGIRAFANMRLARRWYGSQYDDRDGEFDLFLSYKSENANSVRTLADRLSAAGRRVWFAEYAVLLRGRENFQQAIDHGASHARRAILFTNKRYYQSEHCRAEAALLLPRCGSSQTLEVRLPDELSREERNDIGFLLREEPHEVGTLIRPTGQQGLLDECRHLVADGTSDQPYTWVRAEFPELNLPDAPGASPAQPTARHVGVHAGQGYLFDCTGWTVRHEGQGPMPSGDVDGPYLAAEFGGFPAYCKLVAGTGHAEMNPLLEPRPEESDDRRLYNRVGAFAATWLDLSASECRGVHLLFDHRGRTHLGLTYWMWSQPQWQRRYSIVLPHPQHGQLMEFAFTFGFFGPYRELCRAAPDFERLVLSLRWGEADLRGDPAAN